MPLRVLFVTDVDLSGSSGQNVATREVVQALARRRDVELWIACPRSDDPSLEGLWKEAAGTLFLPRKKRRSPLWGLLAQLVLSRHLWRTLRSHPFDLIVARRGSSLAVPPLFARGFRIRYVLLQRGIRLDDERSFTEKLLRVPLSVVGLLNIRCADRVFVAYEEVKERIDRDRLPEQSRATILPNAVDPAKFQPVSRGEARSRLPNLGLAMDDIVIGFVGSFQERHRVDVLLEAMAEVRRMHPNAKFLGVGDGPERPALVKFATKLRIRDAVLFPGLIPHEEVSLYLTASDVLVAIVQDRRPSNPIKIYEYLACGRPVVTSARPEFDFIEREALGRLVFHNTPQKIAEALVAILSLADVERQRMGERAREYVVEHHTWAHFAGAILEPGSSSSE